MGVGARAGPSKLPLHGARGEPAAGVHSRGPGRGGAAGLPTGDPEAARVGGRARKAAGRGRAVLRAAGGAVRTLGPGRERSSCLKGRRGTWLGRSSRPPGRSSEAGRLRSASAAACAPRQARQARPRRAAERGTRAAMAGAAPARVSAPAADAQTGRGRRRRRRQGPRGSPSRRRGAAPPRGLPARRLRPGWRLPRRASSVRPPPRSRVRAGLSGRPTGRPKRQAGRRGRRGGPDGGGQAGLPSNTSDDRPCIETEWLFPPVHCLVGGTQGGQGRPAPCGSDNPSLRLREGTGPRSLT